MIDMEEMERVEYERAKRLSDDIGALMKNEAFMRVIFDEYIDNTALVVGSGFDGSDYQVEALKAISHLKLFLTNSVL